MNKFGFLLVHKPKGITSFDLIAKLRKKLGIKQIGHSGTLDPLTTGLMLVGVGQACKFLQWHKSDKKTYQAEITLGKTSETFDGEGPIIETNYKREISKQKILEILEGFKGNIIQTPPKYSAIKIEGRKLCDITRKGESVNIPQREITISNLIILDYNYPILKLDITCSSGTYIRSLASDIGKRLSCGAYLSGLVRTKIENHDLKNAIKLDDISLKQLKSSDFGLEQIEKLELKEGIIKRLKHGQRINMKDISENGKLKIENLVRLYSNGNFCGIGNISIDSHTGSKILKGEKIIKLGG